MKFPQIFFDLLNGMYMRGVLKGTSVGTNGNSYTLEACDYLCGLFVTKLNIYTLIYTLYNEYTFRRKLQNTYQKYAINTKTILHTTNGSERTITGVRHLQTADYI